MAPTLAKIMDEHVTLEMESIDRLYLNGYIPGLQTPAAVAYVHSYEALVGLGLADVVDGIAAAPTPVRKAMAALQSTMQLHARQALQAVA